MQGQCCCWSPAILEKLYLQEQKYKNTRLCLSFRKAVFAGKLRDKNVSAWGITLFGIKEYVWVATYTSLIWWSLVYLDCVTQSIVYVSSCVTVAQEIVQCAVLTSAF